METWRGNGRRHPSAVTALVFGIWIVSGPLASGYGDGGAGPAAKKKASNGLFGRRGPTKGTLGYGPPGVHPGFQGFGLGYGLGHGFGGSALGVGAEGGFPLYGGPGYPHPGPALQRLPVTRIEPFCFLGGSGYPSPEHPNHYGTVGPLVADDPVVKPGDDSPDSSYADAYGAFTGTLPYPEQTFAPFSTAGGDPSTDAEPFDNDPTPPPPPPLSPPPPPSPPPATDAIPLTVKPAGPSKEENGLGVDLEPNVAVDGEQGLKVTRVYPGKAAEKSRIVAGDLIRSANGHVTEEPSNLAWVIANAAPDRVLRLSVRTAKDGQVRIVTARLR